mmetsp:Transcript_28778/g.73314  ORF Transcript_28778/g.73314 Transcript_28778/m.73314 type:complete len:148 (-) Transcript_28778:751-1194(-)
MSSAVCNSEAAGPSGGHTSFTSEVPRDIFDLAVLLSRSLPISEEDPVLVLDLNDAALEQRQLGVPAAQAKAAISAIVTGAGMREVADAAGSPSHMLFSGSMSAYQAAVNALCYTPWVRPAPPLPDVGRAWAIMGPTTSVPLASPFNA